MSNSKDEISTIKKIKDEINKVKKVFTDLRGFIGSIGFDNMIPGDMFADGVKSALEVETAVQEINRVMGESTNQFAMWSRESALAFNISQADAMNYGASFSKLVSNFAGDSEETVKYTTDLLKATSIIASGTGRTMEDVMGRIQSGLTGNSEAMEELGINTDVSMLQSTEAFKKFANGKSWDELSEQTQQQIRLFGILDQTSNNFGDGVSNSTNSALQQLGAILKDVALNIGSAFLPIMDFVLPILNDLAMGVRDVTGDIASFISTFAGRANIAIGVDIEDIDTSNIESMLKPAQESFERFKGSLEPIIDGISENIMNFLNNILIPLASWTISEGIPAFFDMLSGALDILNPILEVSRDLGMWLWESFLQPIASWSGGVIVDVLSGLADTLSTIGSWMSDNKEVVKAIVIIVGSLATAIGLVNIAMAIWSGISWLCTYGTTALGVALLSVSWPLVLITGAIAAIIAIGVLLCKNWDTVKEFASSTWEWIQGVWSGVCAWFDENVIQPVVNFFAGMWQGIQEAASFAWEWIVSVWIAVSTWFDENVIQPIVNFFTLMWEGIKTAASFAWEWIVSVWIAVSTWFDENVIQPIVNFFTLMWEGIKTAASFAWEWIVSVWIAVSTWFDENVIQPIVNFFAGMWEGIKTAASSAWEWIVGIWTNVSTWFDENVVQPIANFFSGMWEGIKNATSDAWNWICSLFSRGGSIFSGVVGAIANVFRDIVNSIISGINKVIKVPFDIINGLLNTIRDVEILGFTPFDEFWGYNPLSVPQIPQLARGGVINKATLAIVGEAGKEAVMPLENNTGWINLLADKLGSKMPQGSSNNGYSGDLILMIDGSTIGKVALSQLRKMQRQGGITLIPT